MSVGIAKSVSLLKSAETSESAGEVLKSGAWLKGAEAQPAVTMPSEKIIKRMSQ
jgi:hypothetical protein